MERSPDHPVEIRWLTAFLDVPASGHAEAGRFWSAVTGSRLSESRGDTGQFATFLPADGDAYLRLQRIDAGPPGIHLDLHVDDLAEAASYAEGLGAVVTARHNDVIVLRSPGGLPFCVVPHRGEHAPPSTPRAPEGRRSLVDQVCIDITPVRYAAERDFWGAVTGWSARSTDAAHFDRLDPPEGQPLQLLLQRLETPADGPTTAHLDLACDSVPEETSRHESLGARVEGVFDGWTTMIDPSGGRYCLTRRTPSR